MKKIFIVIFGMALLNDVCGQSPVYNWSATQGGYDYDGGLAVGSDHKGCVYTIGYFESTAFFDVATPLVSLTSAGIADIFISKHDSSGNLIWAKRIGTPGREYGYGLWIDDSANVFITGDFSDTVDMDPGPATHNLISNGSYDIFVAKFDSSGQFIWAVSRSEEHTSELQSR